MRRVLAAAAALWMMLLLFCPLADAAGGQLSLCYVPRSERGSLFYLDIAYEGELSAAMFTLRFDSALTEYRSIDACAAFSTVKAKADGSTVQIVFGDSGCVSGSLCRLTFKALGVGSAAFSLRMTEGVDGGLSYIEPLPSCGLTVSLEGSGASDPGGSGSGGRSVRGGTSSKSTVLSDTADDATGDERALRSVRDISPSFDGTWVMIGAAAGVLAALLVIGGFLIGRKSRGKEKPAADDGGEEMLSEEESTVNPMDEL